MSNSAREMLANRIKEGRCPICNKIINPKFPGDYKFIVARYVFPDEFLVCKKHKVEGEVK